MAIKGMALLLAGAAVVLAGCASGVRNYAVEGWRVRVKEDRFGASRSCSITRQSVSVSHGEAVFQFGKGSDTSSAVYRIDNGAPVQAIMPDADRLTDNMSQLTNPSGGRVKVPLDQLALARQVQIRPSGRAKARSFDVAGLGDAVAFAAHRDCLLN
jgi:hypothetical protein